MPPFEERSSAFLEGPAFSIGAKLLASLLMIALAGYGWRSLDALLSTPWSWPAMLLIAVAFSVLVLCYGWMLYSRTRISATHILQTWLPDKRVALTDITQIKLIYLPRLAWLITPRLVVRARMPGAIVFHAAEPKVLEAFVRLTLGMPPLR